MARVPEEVAQKLTRPGREWAQEWDDLPRTLLHGDVKVANFAIVEGGKVAAFDWAMCGAGPCSVDLGWYLAVNASRLAGTKEEVIARYRALLGIDLGDATWRRLEDAAIILGARMLLWAKAAALESGRAGAQEEWDWWMERLRG
jgi:aminoglycoside phosphotransferase (APT) family kinase protein